MNNGGRKTKKKYGKFCIQILKLTKNIVISTDIYTTSSTRWGVR